MLLFFKLILTLLMIGAAFFYGYMTKNKCKRIIGVMLILLVTSLAFNHSIFWILYWDGSYYGHVVDADTSKPIEGASVAGIWEFEHSFLNLSFNGFANATETVTDANGAFKLGPIIAFSFWPFTTLENMNLVVFKPGYDSYPPVIRRKMSKPKKAPVSTTDGKYLVGRYIDCHVWSECEVRLNKAITIKERRRASAECSSSLMEWDINPSKIKKFIIALKKDDPYFKKWMEN